MRSSRLRGYLDALGVLICEVALFGFFLMSGGLLGTVPFGHFSSWAQSEGAERVLTALFRLLGLGVSGWLLLSTLTFVAGVVSGSRRLLQGSRLITLPVVRRALDALAAASVAASTIGTVAGAASAAPVPRVVFIASAAPSPGRGPMAAAPATSDRGGPGRVSATAVGRHLPHPGTAKHVLPHSAPADDARSKVPSPQNGFAGLVPGTKVVVVQPGDCLSVLAQRHLGDWRLDSELEALNRGRVQPDGRALVDDHWIYPGWVLVMPKDAVGTLVVGEGAGARSVVRGTVVSGSVVRGHNRVHSPSGTAPVERPQPRETKVVSPDWAAPPPGAHVPIPAPPPLPVPSSSAPVSGPEPRPHPDVRPHPEVRPQPEGVRPLPEGVRPQPEGVRPLPEGVRPLPEVRAHSALHHGFEGKAETGVVALAGVGALVAAGIVWRLDRLRREQAHARPKGRHFARNRPTVEAAERRARAVAADGAVMWADLALRYLTGLVEQLAFDGAASVPSLVLLRLGRKGLEVVLSPAPEGRFGWFSANEDGTAFVLDADIALDDLKALAEQRWPAWPAVVSIGECDGSTLLVNLEHAGSLSVEGPADRVEGTLAGFALQLASQPWCDEMLAGLYILGSNPMTLESLAVRHVGSDEALDLAERFDRIGGAHMELTGELPLSALRAVACEALPHVAIAFGQTPAGALRCLAEASVPDRSGVALVGAGPYSEARWRLLLDRGSGASLQGEIGGRAVCYEMTVNCDPQEVALLSEALGATSDRDGVPGADGPGATGPGPAGPAPGEVIDIRPDGDVQPLSEATGTAVTGPEGPARGHVEVCVLGPVDVVGGDPSALETSRRMAALSLLAYMATHPRLVSADELASNLWPLDAAKDDLAGPQRKTVMNVISRARALLGCGPDGKERLVYSSMGYRLSEDVSCDWGRFERLVANARRQSPEEAAVSLRQALELVRGEPFGGALSSQFFDWVASEHLDMTLAAKVVDAAQDLGEIGLHAGDLETVMWAVEKGLQLEPTREEMFRLWMHALGRTGRPAKVDDVYRRLRLVLRQRIHPLQEPQPQTRQVWKSYTSDAASAPAALTNSGRAD